MFAQYLGVAVWPAFLGVLALLLLLSGLDDLMPVTICLWGHVRRNSRSRQPAQTGREPERRIAILVPCWQESAVIGKMIRHNLSAIRYSRYDFFLGVYPNDPATVRVAQELAADFTNVHAAECPHDGPTSKADCLNWAFREMQYREQEQGFSFDTVVLHDAEDLIHPLALHVINRERENYEMVQVPVLPLPTGFSDATHGVYCDEFAEFQTIDMRARQISGSFVPSNGVGTGFSREVLARLALDSNDKVFNPDSLTEDYEIGVRIHALGYRQCFAPLETVEGDWVATREYFPRTMETAVRQRTRWVTGIALQCWERHGWRGSWRTRYWFWRDRKGLLTNPLSLVANALFIAGMIDWIASQVFGWKWMFEISSVAVARLCLATMVLQCTRTALRAVCVGRIYGVNAAMAVPLRAFHANLINSRSALRAVRDYVEARRTKRSLTWRKTEHAYPGRKALGRQRRHLADVLVGCGYINESALEAARNDATTASLDLALLANGLISEQTLCKAISLQSGLVAARLDLNKVRKDAIRALPSYVEQRHRVLPIGIEAGRLVVASASTPSEEAYEEVAKLSALPVEFQVVTHSEYAGLRAML